MKDKSDEDLRKVFQRYETLIFKAANSIKEEDVYGYQTEFGKKLNTATQSFKQLAKRYVDKAIPNVKFSENTKTVLQKRGVFHETPNVKYTTYVQMVSKLTASAEQFKDRIQERINQDELNGITTTVTDLKEYISAELKSGVGIAVTYSNGAKMPTDKYASMLARTVRTETNNLSMVGKALDDGNDLVECSTISPTCDICAMYQGRIYSISGNTPGYPSLYDTVFKRGYSIIHPNCRHRFYPYDPTFHTAEERARLEENTRKPFTEGGQSERLRTAYAKSQMQMRAWNKEMNEFAEMQKLYNEQGEKAPYKNLGSFRRAYRSEKGSLAYAKSHYARSDLRQYEEFEEVLGKHRVPETLVKFQEMKYNNKNEFELFVGFKKANQKQHISPLVSFEVYKNVSQEIDHKLIGKTFDGITIKGKKTHFIDRIIGEYQESDYKQSGKRQGVSIEEVVTTLNTPRAKIKRTNDDETVSLTFIGNTCKVTLNPETGILIQTNKNSRGKK